jgi:hypothetical protein
VLYVLAESEAEIARARAAIQAYAPARILHVIPCRPLNVVDAALEVACLEALRADDRLLAEDPLVSVEIDELLAVARRHLDLAVHRLTSDRPTEAKWSRGGVELQVSADRPAAIVACELMGEWYPKTPRIANDQLMRLRISKQMNTARAAFDEDNGVSGQAMDGLGRYLGRSFDLPNSACQHGAAPGMS